MPTTLWPPNPIHSYVISYTQPYSVLGNSIANDPCYGGELFYGDPERRQRAVDVLRGMRREGKHPLSKVPHLGDPELDNPPPMAAVSPSSSPSLISESKSDACEGTIGILPASAVTDLAGVEDFAAGQGSDESETTASADTAILPPVVIEPQGEGETDKEYLVRTCRCVPIDGMSMILDMTKFILHCEIQISIVLPPPLLETIYCFVLPSCLPLTPFFLSFVPPSLYPSHPLSCLFLSTSPSHLCSLSLALPL
jgi:hypothetical protein